MLLRAGADPLFPSPDDEITAVDCSKFSLKASPALAGLFSRFLQAEQRSKGASSSSARAEPKAGKAKTGSDLRGSGAVLLPQVRFEGLERRGDVEGERWRSRGRNRRSGRRGTEGEVTANIP